MTETENFLQPNFVFCLQYSFRAIPVTKIWISRQFSSIYFRNVTFYQIPPYFEFDDRYEVLFSNVYTDEGSNKIEPFDIRVKNSNFTRNPVFRMENSRLIFDDKFRVFLFASTLISFFYYLTTLSKGKRVMYKLLRDLLQ